MKNTVKKQFILVISLLAINTSLHAMQKNNAPYGLEKLIQSASNSTVWNYCCKPLEYAARAYQESNYLAHSHPIYHHNDNKTLEAAISLAGKLQGPAPKRLVARTKAPLTSQTTAVQKFTNSSVQTNATDANTQLVPALQQITQPNLQSFTSKNRLNKIAVKQGYGFKTANLKVLTDLAQHKELQKLPGGYTVEVPSFVGVSHEQITKLLKAQGLDINQEWNQLLKLVTPEEKSEFKLSEQFITGIEALSQKIEAAFEKTAQETKSLNNPALNKLIQTCAHNKSYITTRSTGREDTEELANAGGNASVEIVTPTTENVIRGMGAVISSYFKHKSFSQRATAKDSKLFDVPLMPVLVQTVVGETPGNPVSGCVSYTQEAQSNSKNLAISQCTHGHTKSVVDNMNPVDSYYHVHTTNKTYSVIKQKLQRQAPTIKDNGKFGLTQTNNSKQETTSQSLTQEEQQALAQTLQFVEKAYGKVMDLELLVDHNKKIIYLFQARPLVIKKPSTPPSYVKDLNLFEQSTITSALKMSEAGGSIRHITHTSQVLTGPTLDDALAKYLQTRDTSFDVVIVQEKAEATSHAAAVFNGLGKAMLVVKSVHDIENKLKQATLNLLVDVQRGKIIDLKDQSFKELKNKEVIKKGRFNHPLPSIMSIPKSKAPQKLLGFYQEQEDQFTQATLDDLLEALKEGSKTNVQHAQHSILTRLAHEIKDKQAAVSCNDSELCPMKKETAQQAATALESIFTQACQLSKHIEKTADSEARSLERLLPITFLEALLKQMPQENLVDVYSYESVLKKHNDFVNFVTKRVVPLVTPQTSDAKINLYENKQCPATILQNVALLEVAQQGVEAAFTKTTEDSWIQFVANLDTQKHKQLFKMTETIEKLEMFPLWITLIFPDHAQESDGFDKLYADYKQDSKFLETLKVKKELMQATNFSAWADAQNFEKLHAKFRNELLDWFSEDTQLFDIIKNKMIHTFASAASQSVMRYFVEIFDQIIKSVKSNEAESVETRVTNFKIILKGYLELLQSWSELIPEGKIQYNPSWRLNRYVQQMQTIFIDLNKSQNRTQLEPSQGFNVGAAALGAATELSRHFPETLEDFFTTIHQSLIVINSSLLDIEIKKLCLPPRVNFALTSVTSTQGRSRFPQRKPFQNPTLTGITFTNNSLIFFYNISLNNHSAGFEVHFNKTKKQTTIHSKFYGPERNRWDNLCALAKINRLSQIVSKGPMGIIISTEVIGAFNEYTKDLTKSISIANEETFNLYEPFLKKSENSSLLYYSLHEYLNTIKNAPHSYAMMNNALEYYEQFTNNDQTLILEAALDYITNLDHSNTKKQYLVFGLVWSLNKHSENNQKLILETINEQAECDKNSDQHRYYILDTLIRKKHNFLEKRLTKNIISYIENRQNHDDHRSSLLSSIIRRIDNTEHISHKTVTDLITQQIEKQENNQEFRQVLLRMAFYRLKLITPVIIKNTLQIINNQKTENNVRIDFISMLSDNFSLLDNNIKAQLKQIITHQRKIHAGKNYRLERIAKKIQL